MGRPLVLVVAGRKPALVSVQSHSPVVASRLQQIDLLAQLGKLKTCVYHDQSPRTCTRTARGTWPLSLSRSLSDFAHAAPSCLEVGKRPATMHLADQQNTSSIAFKV